MKGTFHPCPFVLSSFYWPIVVQCKTTFLISISLEITVRLTLTRHLKILHTKVNQTRPNKPRLRPWIRFWYRRILKINCFKSSLIISLYVIHLLLRSKTVRKNLTLYYRFVHGTEILICPSSPENSSFM